MKQVIIILSLFSSVLLSCKKHLEPETHYYQVRMKTPPVEWRDSAFIIATKDPQLITEATQQLKLPVAQRKLVNGALLPGNAGYNRNAGHQFKWHFDESNWKFADASIEIFDGRPYSDVDADTRYWLHTMKRFAPWSSYIAKEIYQAD